MDFPWEFEKKHMAKKNGMFMAMDIVDLWQLILWIYRRSIVDR
jgi:hypothetical protein